MVKQETVARGALAGLTATVPMTMSMAMLRRVPDYDRTPLPPERVARGVERKVGIEPEPNTLKHAAFTYSSHFAFGAAAGALYTALVGQPQRNASWKGIGFGLGVWAVSYLGWLPALRILPLPDKTSKQHLASQILSHVIWGATLGALSGFWESRSSSPSALRKLSRSY